MIFLTNLARVAILEHVVEHLTKYYGQRIECIEQVVNYL